MAVPSGDGDGATGESAHSRGGVRAPPGQGAPVAELSLVVHPPALHPVPKQRTGVTERSGDGSGATERSAASAHLHRGGRTRGGPVAELPLVVPPPALHRAVRKQGTGVIPPSGDGIRSGDSTHRHRGVRTEDIRGGRWVRAVIARRGDAELPVRVPPPTPHGAVAEERTGVKAPGGDRASGDSGPEAHRDWIGLGS